MHIQFKSREASNYLGKREMYVEHSHINLQHPTVIEFVQKIQVSLFRRAAVSTCLSDGTTGCALVCG